ncbi:uncharacterized protein Nmlp_1391 [Natronomonas moolapensis 8.8.11]|uniref:Uncharacterized protein n=1 Tax=Natronomonas moolapensis (strain DSM 18674 / CECT 7526 / JCM 14361 / 8.8.11) TaxID=268739 RepID=M1XNS0_NATM8|nr:uncharacterized protein Nmlp_1391 [Natronomonas moolapensis 8.8.11]
MIHTQNTTDTDGTERTNAGTGFINPVRGSRGPAAAFINHGRGDRNPDSGLINHGRAGGGVAGR